MDAQLESSSNGSRAYIRPDKAAIDAARKSATKMLLSKFEELIEPLVAGNEKAVHAFKGVCRKQINRLAYEAQRAAESGPDEVPGPLSADLAEDFAFDDRED